MPMPLSRDLSLQSSQTVALWKGVQSCKWEAAAQLYLVSDLGLKFQRCALPGFQAWCWGLLSVRLNKFLFEFGSWKVWDKTKKEKCTGITDFYSFKFSQDSACFELLTSYFTSLHIDMGISLRYNCVLFYWYYCKNAIWVHQVQLHWGDEQLKALLP